MVHDLFQLLVLLLELLHGEKKGTIGDHVNDFRPSCQRDGVLVREGIILFTWLINNLHPLPTPRGTSLPSCDEKQNEPHTSVGFRANYLLH